MDLMGTLVGTFLCDEMRLYVIACCIAIGVFVDLSLFKGLFVAGC